jgi:uncharacterized membrane protein
MEHVLTTPAGIPVSAAVVLKRKTTYRIDSIDLLRGLVMIIMALDHTRDFFHKDAWTDDPLNLATTTPILFFTRWITHFCAPVFVFLAGTSGWFQSQRKSKKELSLFLIKRGVWLILMEITLVNFSFSFDINFGLIALQTIWAIGISMVILGLAIWLPFAAILGFGLLIVLGHNALDFYEAKRQAFPFWYSLLHKPGIYPISTRHTLMTMYPFLSWSGLMLLGYCFGKLFTSYEGVQRKRILTALGIGVILFFIAMRAANSYGNPGQWSVQINALYTALSFIDTNKYPPSLLYICMTIGPAILFLAWIGNVTNRLSRMITVYGRVPFFYYILHFYLIHFISAVLSFTRGHSVAEGIHEGSGQFLPNFIYPSEGYSLLFVYGMWLVIVLALYPLCKWFSDYKKNHTQWWLSYL